MSFTCCTLIPANPFFPLLLGGRGSCEVDVLTLSTELYISPSLFYPFFTLGACSVVVSESYEWEANIIAVQEIVKGMENTFFNDMLGLAL